MPGGVGRHHSVGTVAQRSFGGPDLLPPPGEQRPEAEKAEAERRAQEEKEQRQAERSEGRSSGSGRGRTSAVERIASRGIMQVIRTVTREIVRGLFGTGRRR